MTWRFGAQRASPVRLGNSKGLGRSGFERRRRSRREETRMATPFVARCHPAAQSGAVMGIRKPCWQSEHSHLRMQMGLLWVGCAENNNM